MTTGTTDDAAPAREAPSFRRARPRRRWLRWLLVPVVLVGLLFLGGKLFLKPYKIPSPSMAPTIAVGDRILMRRGGYEPKVNDLVIVHPPEAAMLGGDQCQGGEPGRGRSCETPGTGRRAATAFVKRIVAGPGDRVELRAGRVLRNGRPTDDAGFGPCEHDTCTFAAYTLPAGHWLTLGDNRANSDDGRFWGPVPGAAIDGPVVGRYWPLSRLGGL